MSKKRRIGRNLQFRALSALVIGVTSFALLPFIVSRVGKEVYGIYLLALTVTGYFNLLDLGVVSAVAKFVAELRGKGDSREAGHVISASLSFYVLVGLVACLVLLLLSLYFEHIFGVAAENRAVVQRLFQIFAVTALLAWPTTAFRGAVRGLQLWDREAVVDIAGQIAYAAAAVFLLSSGFGIVALALAYQLIGIVAGVMLFLIARRNLKGARLSFPFFRRDIFGKIFSFSGFIFLAGLVNIVIFQIDGIIVGAFVSVAAVTTYSVAFALQNYLRTINSVVGAPPWTACAEMEGRGDFEGQRELFFKGTRYITLACLPMTVIAIAFARPLVMGWMGKGFVSAVLPAQVLLSFWLLNYTVEIGAGIVSAKGLVRRLFFIQLANGIANLVLSLVLVRPLGILGVALGTALPMAVLGFPLVLAVALRTLGVGLETFFRKAVRDGVLAAALAAAASMVALQLAYPGNVYLTFGEMALVYAGVMLVSLFGLVSREERVELRTVASIRNLVSIGAQEGA